MQMSRKELVEMFIMLGFPSANNWSPLKLKDRLATLHTMPKEQAANLTPKAKKTFFQAQAAAEAAAEGWADPVGLLPPKRKKSRDITVSPFIDLTDKEASKLLEWMNKMGFRTSKLEWDAMDYAEKEDLVLEAVERLVKEFLSGGQL